MRVNVYEEELTEDIVIVETTVPAHPFREPGQGATFYGVRVFLESSPKLHHTPTDDDRSAVTFWVGSHQRAEILRDHLRRDLRLQVSDNRAATNDGSYGRVTP